MSCLHVECMFISQDLFPTKCVIFLFFLSCGDDNDEYDDNGDDDDVYEYVSL